MEKLTEEEYTLLNSLLQVAINDNLNYYKKVRQLNKGLENLDKVILVGEELINFSELVVSIQNKLKCN